jgi:hypothetical protein
MPRARRLGAFVYYAHSRLPMQGQKHFAERSPKRDQHGLGHGVQEVHRRVEAVQATGALSRLGLYGVDLSLDPRSKIDVFLENS